MRTCLLVKVAGFISKSLCGLLGPFPFVSIGEQSLDYLLLAGCVVFYSNLCQPYIVDLRPTKRRMVWLDEGRIHCRWNEQR
jgi:hypothetical protein